MRRQANCQVTLKILVVDDEPIVVRVVESVLRKAGYDITAAENADAALELAAANRGSIALLIVNHSLNARPSRNLVDDLLAVQPNMQVLRFSGHLESELRASGELRAESFFIQKPFTSKQLLDKVREIVGEP
jgi:two-component system cell cycle sensor histidine kinase/response regulator CckA